MDIFSLGYFSYCIFLVWDIFFLGNFFSWDIFVWDIFCQEIFFFKRYFLSRIFFPTMGYFPNAIFFSPSSVVLAVSLLSDERQT